MDNKLENLKEVYGYVLPQGLLFFNEKIFRDKDTFNMLYTLRQAGWEDTSYKNDTCPSLELDTGRTTFKLYIDYPNPEDREVDTGCRFTIYELCPHTEEWGEEPVYQTHIEANVLEYFWYTPIVVQNQQS